MAPSLLTPPVQQMPSPALESEIAPVELTVATLAAAAAQVLNSDVCSVPSIRVAVMVITSPTVPGTSTENDSAPTAVLMAFSRPSHA